MICIEEQANWIGKKVRLVQTDPAYCNSTRQVPATFFYLSPVRSIQLAQCASAGFLGRYPAQESPEQTWWRSKKSGQKAMTFKEVRPNSHEQCSHLKNCPACTIPGILGVLYSWGFLFCKENLALKRDKKGIPKKFLLKQPFQYHVSPEDRPLKGNQSEGVSWSTSSLLVSLWRQTSQGIHLSVSCKTSPQGTASIPVFPYSF